LQREGAQLIISDINEAAGREAAAKLGADFIAQDVSQEAQWVQHLDDIKQRYGGLDILVNNAGINGENGMTPETATIEDWRRVQAINVESVFFACKHALPLMRESGGGSIVNISSIAAVVATPFITAYGASKAAVRQLTMSVASHGAAPVESPQGRVRCNSVHPGQMRTPMLEALYEQNSAATGMSIAEIEAGFVSRIPMGELGTPEDIANMVLFLASDESRYITGGQFMVDGGMQLNG
jgi:NAD(P)-dependent dehydrogenase (short-subunit alcohol dehydrogenase family)